MVKPIDTDLKTGLKTDLKGDGVEVRKKRLKEACKDFEAVMTGYIFKAMQSNPLKVEEPDHGRAMFEEMLCEATATEASRRDNLGIGDVLYRQLLPMVRVQQDGEDAQTPAPEGARTQESAEARAKDSEAAGTTELKESAGSSDTNSEASSKVERKEP